MIAAAPLNRSQSVNFDVSQDVLNLGVRVKVIAIAGLNNKDTAPAFEQIKDQAVNHILAQLSAVPIADDPILRGFREIHSAISFSNRNFPAASESLLEYIRKNRTLPHINLLVDIYNLVSVQTRLSLGAHDLAHVSGDIHLRMTTGTEKFIPLGSAEPKPVRTGGYAYIDDDNEVICFMEVKQVEKTKATLATRECFYIIQGNKQTDESTVQAAVDQLVDLTTRFCGGQVRFFA